MNYEYDKSIISISWVEKLPKITPKNENPTYLSGFRKRGAKKRP